MKRRTIHLDLLVMEVLRMSFDDELKRKLTDFRDLVISRDQRNRKDWMEFFESLQQDLHEFKADLYDKLKRRFEGIDQRLERIEKRTSTDEQDAEDQRELCGTGDAS